MPRNLKEISQIALVGGATALTGCVPVPHEVVDFVTNDWVHVALGAGLSWSILGLLLRKGDLNFNRTLERLLIGGAMVGLLKNAKHIQDLFQSYINLPLPLQLTIAGPLVHSLCRYAKDKTFGLGPNDFRDKYLFIAPSWGIMGGLILFGQQQTTDEGKLLSYSFAALCGLFGTAICILNGYFIPELRRKIPKYNEGIYVCPSNISHNENDDFLEVMEHPDKKGAAWGFPNPRLLDEMRMKRKINIRWLWWRDGSYVAGKPENVEQVVEGIGYGEEIVDHRKVGRGLGYGNKADDFF